VKSDEHKCTMYSLPSLQNLGYKYSVGEEIPCFDIKLEVSVQCFARPIEELLANKTMCDYPTITMKENRNVECQIQSCSSCQEPVFLMLKKLPEHTLSTQISRVLFHSRCLACCGSPDNLLCVLLIRTLSILRVQR
jgi:hypothetical protein